MRRFLKKLTFRLVAVVIALLLVLALTEIALRVLWDAPDPGYPPGLFVAKEPAGYLLAPDYEARHATAGYDITIRTNSDGYRSPEITDVTPDTLRILALGDSFGFGHGVEGEEAYPARLEALLQSHGTKAQVVNTGVPGYGTLDELEILEKEAPRLRPRIVLLGFYIGNDFRGNWHSRFGRFAACSGLLVPTDDGSPGLGVSLAAAAVANSRLAQLLKQRFPTVEPETTETREWNPAFTLAMLRKEWGADERRAFGITTDLLARIADHCRSNDTRLLIALLPGPPQYDESIWEQALKMSGMDGAQLDRARPNRELLAWGRSHGVEIVDLLADFLAASATKPKERLYIDVHFSATGHDLAARRLARHLLGESGDDIKMPGALPEPTDARGYADLCATLIRREDPDGAERAFLKATALAPNDAEVPYRRGLAWLSRGEHLKAERDFSHAIRLDSGHAGAFLNRGRAYAGQEKWKRATGNFDKAIALDGSVAEAYYERGLAWLARKKPEVATGNFDTAISLDRKNAKAYCARGIAWQARGDDDAALRNFSTALGLDTTLLPALERRAALREKRGDTEGAAKDRFRIGQLKGASRSP